MGMRRSFAATSILPRGGIGPLVHLADLGKASVCVYVVALSVLVPPFDAVERAGAHD